MGLTHNENFKKLCMPHKLRKVDILDILKVDV